MVQGSARKENGAIPQCTIMISKADISVNLCNAVTLWIIMHKNSLCTSTVTFEHMGVDKKHKKGYRGQTIAGKLQSQIGIAKLNKLAPSCRIVQRRGRD